MNYDSVLNGTVLSNQCNDLANNLKYEIAFYNSEITAINTYIESDTISETADKIRGNAAIMIQALKSMITADECDIRDFNRLSEMVNGVNIDGYEVLTRLKEAQRNADDCNNQAEEYSRMALSCPIGSISDHSYLQYINLLSYINYPHKNYITLLFNNKEKIMLRITFPQLIKVLFVSF